VRGEIHRATLDTPLEVPENAVVVPGSRAVSSRQGSSSEVKKDGADAWGLSLYTPVIVKYRDQKTDRGIELEDWLR
jgi:2,3,4,5-tetrahydropyridine-2-carboxylate N-succinyltransferase